MAKSELTTKGERTRQAILDSALRLFLERGYEATTMRVVAEEAGVSTGNAYYYFESKDHLIQGFYARTHDEHMEACEELLETTTDFKERLIGVLNAKVDTAEPYHRFSGQLFKTAADPKSPLSPFSKESADVRDEAIQLMARVLEGSRTRVPGELGDRLPELLWLYEMAIILYWIHDESPNRQRTRRLIERTADIVVRLVSLASVKLLAPLRRAALNLLDDLRPGTA